MSANPNRTLSPNVIDILGRAKILPGNRLTLPPKLDREDYVAVNFILQAIGAHWERGLQCHLFRGGAEGELAARVDIAIEEGNVVNEKKLFQAYYTPPMLALHLARKADVAGRHVLEPSAGGGALASACADLVVLDLNPRSAAALQAKYPHAGRGPLDFLQVAPIPDAVDRIVINPPFTWGAGCPACQACPERVERFAIRGPRGEGGPTVVVGWVGVVCNRRQAGW